MAVAGPGQAERKQRALQALRGGNTRKAAAAYAGVLRGTFDQWCDDDEEFAQKAKQAEGDAEVLCVAAILNAAKKGDWRAAAWWLEHARPRDWRRFELSDLSTGDLIRLALGMRAALAVPEQDAAAGAGGVLEGEVVEGERLDALPE